MNRVLRITRIVECSKRLYYTYEILKEERRLNFAKSIIISHKPKSAHADSNALLNSSTEIGASWLSPLVKIENEQK